MLSERGVGIVSDAVTELHDINYFFNYPLHDEYMTFIVPWKFRGTNLFFFKSVGCNDWYKC